MLKKVLRKSSSVMLSVLSLVAVSSVSVCCAWFLGQPKEPECLRNLDSQESKEN